MHRIGRFQPFALNFLKNQQYAPIQKLYRDMPLFRYSITLKSSFNEKFDQQKIELFAIKLKKKKNAWNSILGKSSSKTPLQGFKTSLQGLKTPLQGLKTLLQGSLNPIWGLIKFFCRKMPLQDFKTSLQGLKMPLQGTLNMGQSHL